MPSLCAPSSSWRHARPSWLTALVSQSVVSAKHSFILLLTPAQIPDKNLDNEPQGPAENSAEPRENPLEETAEPEEGAAPYRDEVEEEEEGEPLPLPRTPPKRRRRLSTYESSDGYMDLESPEIGGTARPPLMGHRRSLSGSVPSPEISGTARPTYAGHGRRRSLSGSVQSP